MTPDGAGLDAVLEEERDLFEMANLFPRTTGLPVTVWVSPRGGARPDVRIKESQTPGDRSDINDTAVVAVRPSPALLHGDLRPEVMQAVFSCVSLNAGALIAYWDGELDTMELAQRMVRLPS